MKQNSFTYIPLHERINAALEMASGKQTGKSVTQISSETGISRSHLYSLEEKHKENPTMEDKERAGRPLVVDERLERRIIRAIKKEPYKSSHCLTEDLNMGFGEESQIKDRTFRYYAEENGLFSRRPCIKPELTQKHKDSRYDFAEEYKDRDMRFWKNVLFCDETKLELFPLDSRKRVRRPKGERYNEQYVLPAYKHGGDSSIFWGCVSWSGTGELKKIPNILKGKDYANLLHETIPPSLKKLNMANPYIIEDHAKVHDTTDVKNEKLNLGLKLLENFPSKSPDMNPIEGVWSSWKDKITERHPHSLKELESCAKEEWNNLPLEVVRTQIRSLPNRLAEAYNVNGAYTKY